MQCIDNDKNDSFSDYMKTHRLYTEFFIAWHQVDSAGNRWLGNTKEAAENKAKI